MSQLIGPRAKGNSADTSTTSGLPSVVAVREEGDPMTTSTLERPDVRTAPDDAHHATWTCENCRTETRAVRKRCTDCGTSRY